MVQWLRKTFDADAKKEREKKKEISPRKLS